MVDAVRAAAARRRFGALAYRDFRLILFGQVVSALGSWMQLVAQGWLVYNLTGSSFYLGTVALARAIPAIALVLFGGAVADRYDRRAIVATMNGSVVVLATALGILTITGLVEVWHIVVVALLQGIAFSFEVPSRQSLISEIVAPRDVASAVSMNALSFNVSGVVGPAIAALLIEPIGEGGIFMLNGASYLSAVLAACLVRTPKRYERSSGGSLIGNVVDGLRYVRRTPELFAVVGIGTLVALLVRPYLNLLPVFAGDILDVGPRGLGTMNAAIGVGAVLAATLCAVLGRFRWRGLVFLISCALFGAGVVGLALSTDYVVSIAIVTALGFLSTYSGTNSNMILQTHSDPRMRGRVVSLHGLQMMGINPLGVMLLGALGSVYGVPLVLAIAGGLTLLASLWTIVRAPTVRPLD
jgi:MFS family permease